MAAEPQKFFIGVIDFFSILLPGALLTYLLKDDVGARLFGQGYQAPAGTEGWVVFLFTSYLLGHFIFLLGSWLLDDRIYDPIRKATFEEQVKRLAKGQPLSPWVTRRLAAWFIKKEADDALVHAVRIKGHYLDPLQASTAINAFQSCKATLALKHPEALATVQRFEADSKFFRSLLVVLPIVIPWAVLTNRLAIVIVVLPLLILAFWRYVDQRVKATNQAYWYMIVLESQRDNGYRLASTQHRASHAGGVVSRRVGDGIEYLLVQAKNSPQEWVLPKGHIEAGGPMPETAVREVREETGAWACIKGDLSEVSFSVNGELVTARFYLMEELEPGKPSDKARKHTWLSLDKAMAQLSHKESQELLMLAERTRTAP